LSGIRKEDGGRYSLDDLLKKVYSASELEPQLGDNKKEEGDIADE